jgi:pimeloyl-ACP methyl ester carboxylesterase
MHKVMTPAGTCVSYLVDGPLDADRRPALVLVHGSFSNHDANWAQVWPLLAGDFRLCAIARRGRGETTATSGHSLADEAGDVLAVIDAIGAPVHLLGHSYGAHCALLAAAAAPEKLGRLVLYEPPRLGIIAPLVKAELEQLASAGAWEELAVYFFRTVLQVPDADLQQYRGLPEWDVVVSDAPATLGDLRAVTGASFDASRYATLDVPTLLQTGSESPRELYLTDALAAVLPRAKIGVLEGQAHEGMTTAPALYAAQVRAFLQGD